MCGWTEFEKEFARVAAFGVDGMWDKRMECAGGVGGGMSQVGEFEFGGESGCE